MFFYVWSFILAFWPPRTHHQWIERQAIAQEIASTDCDPLECLTLANISALESTFERIALGRSGEVGAWQIMPPAKSYGATEALRRLRAQGLPGYCGCGVSGCPEIVEHRVEKARLYAWAFQYSVASR
jgi:hypothetical protein